MRYARPEKAKLPKGGSPFRNDGNRGCALGVGDDCPPGPLTEVAELPICSRHLDRLRAIAKDAGVPFNIEVAAP